MGGRVFLPPFFIQHLDSVLYFNMQHKYIPIFLLTASLKFANATLVISGEFESTSTVEGAPIDVFMPSFTDLAQNGSPALLSSELTIADFFEEPTSNLGSGDLSATTGQTRGLFFSETFRGGQLPSTLTLTFDTDRSPLGYEIEEIVSYAGWRVNGSALANQQYLLEYSVIDDEDFVSLGVQTFTPFDDDNEDAAGATRLGLTDTTGVIATGVDAIRITFQGHGFSNISDDIDGTVYQEIDIIGTPLSTVDGSVALGDIWFVGDSITQSNADGDNSDSPRLALFELLTANNYDFTFTGHHTANVDGLPSTGDTVETNLFHYHSGISGSVIGDDLGTRVGMTENIDSGQNFWTTGRLDTVKPEIILIMLGTNDMEQNFEVATAPDRITNLIDTIMEQPEVGEPTFFVAQIPPNLRTGAPARVLAFNAALPDIVAEQRLLGRDVYLVDQFTPINADTSAFVRSDELHTNTAGNAVLGQQWYDAIVQRFDPSETASFSAWQFDNFGSSIAINAGLAQDPDGDGNNNLYEFAFGFDPNLADGDSNISFDGQVLTYFARSSVDSNLTYTLEESTTLEANSWTVVEGTTSIVTETNGDFETVEISDVLDNSTDSSANFFRIRVELTE